ncbi:hypothetical protein SCALM49S_04583 [Streptomyces californicus]
MVEDFQTAADTMAAIAQNGLIPTGATERQLDALGIRIATTGRILGEEVAHVSTTVGKMVKTGMARDAEEAMDILVKAQQKGLNASEDLLDTFDEYSTQFRKVGIDGPMAMGLVSQALAGGARDTDIAADAIKEFSLLSIDGSEAAAEAYKALGLDADKMIKILAAGGPKATKAMDTIFDKIRGLDDPVKKNTVAIGLFGTKFEDLGGAFDTMDPVKGGREIRYLFRGGRQGRELDSGVRRCARRGFQARCDAGHRECPGRPGNSGPDAVWAVGAGERRHPAHRRRCCRGCARAGVGPDGRGRDGAGRAGGGRVGHVRCRRAAVGRERRSPRPAVWPARGC